MDAGRVFAIPPGADYAHAFAKGFYARYDALAPLDRALIQIFVPTGRAQSEIEAALADHAPAAGPLPRLRQIPALADDVALCPEVPAVLPPLRRHLRLTHLVQRFLAAKRQAGEPIAPDAAAADLAESLAELIDQFHDAGVPLADLDRAVAVESLTPGAARHWQQSLEFVDLIRTAWPAIQRDHEHGRLDGRARQRAVIATLSEQWAADPPPHPVLVAATTGSVGSTADLMAAVARLPKGALVLPGFDPVEDPVGDPQIWPEAGADHPMGPFRGVLSRLDLTPAAIAPWVPMPAQPRRALIAQALRPAPVTDHWHRAAETLRATLAAATDGIALLEAATPRHEAEAIAAAVRQALEDPACTVAVISPDGALGRRISAALAAYDIVPDDTVGQPLAQSPPGVLLRLILQVASGQASLGDVAGLLQHPLMRPGMTRPQHRALARAYDRAVLRRGPAGAAMLLPDWPGDDIGAQALAWLHTLRDALAPLSEALVRQAPLAQIVAAHRQTASRLTDDGGAQGPEIWREDAGTALAAFFDGLEAAADALGDGPLRDYPALLAGWIRGETLRPKPREKHPRVAIRGPREARLEDATLTILAGLNDGVWPQAADPGPWLSRPMLQALGLPAPERTVGLSAHDFLCGVCRPNVLLTRPLRSDGAPTVASRWLVRLETLLTGIGAGPVWAGIKASGDAYDALARARTMVEPVPRVDRPRPRTPQRQPQPQPPGPPQPLPQPLRRLSVTDVETLIRDAYAVYAKRVLRLTPLDPLGRPPDQRERGTVLHGVVEAFVQATRTWPGLDAASGVFDETAAQVLARDVPWPDLRRIWAARVARFRDWFLAGEDRRRGHATPVGLECDGRLTLALPSGTVLLTAKADRIDRLADGRAMIYDYKSGQVPSADQIKQGFNQQIHLQAAILAAGGFEGLPAMQVAGGAYLGLSGSGDGGTMTEITLAAGEASARVQDLTVLLQAYADGHPWVSRGRPFKTSFVSEYDHLARVAEWAGGDDA